MDVMDAIRGRRAVREYTEDAVEEAVIAELIDAAIQAPSSMNRQAWRFVVITDRALLGHVADQARSFMLASMAQAPEAAHLREHLARPEFDIFYGAPALVVICATTSDQMASWDCCLAAENLMLAAHARGLGSCWIGFAEAWLGQPAGRAALGLPQDARPVAPIILGHPRRQPAAPERRPAQIDWRRGGS